MRLLKTAKDDLLFSFVHSWFYGDFLMVSEYSNLVRKLNGVTLKRDSQ